MILKHHKELCDIEKTTLYDDEVLKGIVKRVSPYNIFVENQEFLDSFATTLVNYSPVSINIIDYWNKDIVDNSGFVPQNPADYLIDIIQPFEFAESDPEVDANFGLGFAATEKGIYGGSLTNTRNDFDPTPNTGICPNESAKRYWINSTIGLQDKLAYINLNNFYTGLQSTIQDTVISQRIYTILEQLNLDTEGLFGNTNVLFNEDRYLANTSYITKKGTGAAVKYVGQSAMDAQLQGKVPLVGDYYMTINEDAPFTYSIESNMLGVIYDRFVRPLTHPVGMIDKFRTVCTSEVANQTEFPLITFNYNELNVFVECLCYVQGEENNPLPPDDAPIDCVFGTYPEKKIFATPTGTGLWEGISQDEGTGNIPFDYQEGVSSELEFKGQTYNMWIFENDNVLISFTKESDSTTSKRVTTQYRRWNGTDYVLAAEFINQRHCNIGYEGNLIKKSIVQETFDTDCQDILYGTFQFLDENETTPPEQPAPSGMYEGFISDLDDDDVGDPFTGGVLKKWTDLYFGDFSFLSEEESENYQVGDWPVTGLKEGFDESGMVSTVTIYEEKGKI